MDSNATTPGSKTGTSLSLTSTAPRFALRKIAERYVPIAVPSETSSHTSETKFAVATRTYDFCSFVPLVRCFSKLSKRFSTANPIMICSV
jgi:hypothetical protein